LPAVAIKPSSPLIVTTPTLASPLASDTLPTAVRKTVAPPAIKVDSSKTSPLSYAAACDRVLQSTALDQSTNPAWLDDFFTTLGNDHQNSKKHNLFGQAVDAALTDTRS
jgi:hypothetical protein